MDRINVWGNSSLETVHDEIFNLIEKEKRRQCRGNNVEKLYDLCNINKNAVFQDSRVLALGGVRIGTLAMTSRGLVEKDFEQIAEFLHQAIIIILKIHKENGKLLKNFDKGFMNNKDLD